MATKKFRITSALVASSRSTRWEDARDHAARKEMLSGLVDWAKSKSSVLLLPAGFFIADTLRQARDLARAAARSGGPGLLLSLGIDVAGPGRKQSAAKEKQSGGPLPFYAFVSEGGKMLVDLEPQLGIGVEEVKKETAEQHARRRVARSKVLGGRKVGLLQCGEALSESMRKEFHSEGPNLVLHPAHQSVNLGENPKRSWANHVDALLGGLPSNSAWAFADHVAGLGHYSSGRLVHLVRARPGRATPIEDSGASVEGAMAYLYEVQLA